MKAAAMKLLSAWRGDGLEGHRRMRRSACPKGFCIKAFAAGALQVWGERLFGVGLSHMSGATRTMGRHGVHVKESGIGETGAKKRSHSGRSSRGRHSHKVGH